MVTLDLKTTTLEQSGNADAVTEFHSSIDAILSPIIFYNLISLVASDDVNREN